MSLQPQCFPGNESALQLLPSQAQAISADPQQPKHHQANAQQMRSLNPTSEQHQNPTTHHMDLNDNHMRDCSFSSSVE